MIDDVLYGPCDILGCGECGFSLRAKIGYPDDELIAVSTILRDLERHQAVRDLVRIAEKMKPWRM